jgi:hypothetical protein
MMCLICSLELACKASESRSVRLRSVGCRIRSDPHTADGARASCAPGPSAGARAPPRTGLMGGLPFAPNMSFTCSITCSTNALSLRLLAIVLVLCVCVHRDSCKTAGYASTQRNRMNHDSTAVRYGLVRVIQMKRQYPIHTNNYSFCSGVGPRPADPYILRSILIFKN